MAMDPVVRSAQRRMMGYVRTRGVMAPDGLTLWTEHGCGEWAASTDELIEDLETLGVSYSVRLAVCRSPWAGPAWTQRQRRWASPHIATDDLPALAAYMPKVIGRLTGALA